MANKPILRINAGDKTQVVFDHTGPASYVPGGETINASDIGLAGGVDWLQAAYWSINQNTGVADYTLQVLWPYNSFLQVSSAKLVWFVQSTGLEAAGGTNLSLEHVRMTGIGN
jgi:hypothetical protein